MKSTLLSLVVIRASNLDAALAFYGALGLNFTQEQHGSGPVHFSCDFGGTVMEIYPGQPGFAPEPNAAGSTMLGFTVSSLDESLDNLRAIGVEPKSPVRESDWGRWVNVTDPDGRMIRINEESN